jgi:protein SCO1
MSSKDGIKRAVAAPTSAWHARRRFAAFFALAWACAGGGHAYAQASVETASERAILRPSKVRIYDLSLLDERGKKIRFHSDLLKGKTVVMGFFYTSCQYICTMQGELFSRLQAGLGDRLGRDVHLVLVSMDPAADTPRRLRKWGAKYGIRPGWTLVTGDPNELTNILLAFTGNMAGKVEMHSSTLFIQDGATGSWFTTEGLPKPEALIKAIDDLGEGKTAPNRSSAQSNKRG